jgi:hypothetical protein
MANSTLWNKTKSLMVVLNYLDDAQLQEYRKALDQILDKSHVKKLTIIVIVPKEVDKTKLPPHFLIYYHSPADFSFWGKLKDVLLIQELEKKFDILLWIGSNDHKIFEFIKNVSCLKKIGVNCSDLNFFDLEIETQNLQPSAQLSYAINTMDKIEIYE